MIGAQVLADYLQQTINRLASDTAKERDLNVFCREMIAFREGMAGRLCERLNDIRYEKLEEEKRQQARDQAQQANGDTKNALVLATLIADEDSLNQDFKWGYEPGTTAQRRRDAEASYQQRMAEQRQWEIDNPEEFAAQKAAQEKADAKWWKKEERNARRRKGSYRTREATPEEQRRGMAEFGEGYEAGEHVSLNQQMKDDSEARQIG